MATSTEAHVPLSYPIQPHELPALEDVATEEVNFGSECSDTEDDNVEHLSDNQSDSEDDGASGTATQLPNANCQHVTSTFTPIAQPIQPSIMPPALLESNPDLIPYFLSMENKVSHLEYRVQNLESDVEAKNDELEAAKAHCAIALSQIRALNKRLNVKRSQARTINACWLTSVEGLQEWEAQDKVREEKKQKKAEGEGIWFSGAISTKSKDDLLDIAHHLMIESTGVKADLLKAIQNHFETHQHLKTDPWFEGLFNGHSCTAVKHPIEWTDLDSENIPPPAICP
ncbi:hypothetical protein EDD16DRAFT_1708315 [Pisolithus croceorrhizus]|nr:hypothetical protein EDD16DRAFT_1708315 [Pisolithus croceorrhizus]